MASFNLSLGYVGRHPEILTIKKTIVKIRNTKFEIRNKSENRIFKTFFILVIRYCFEFRYSDFEFTISFT